MINPKTSKKKTFDLTNLDTNQSKPMKTSLWIIWLTFCVISCEPTSNDKLQPIMENQESLRVANAQLYEALNRMFKGEIEPINNVWSHAEEITYMGPFGGMHSGWAQVRE